MAVPKNSNPTTQSLGYSLGIGLVHATIRLADWLGLQGIHSMAEKIGLVVYFAARQLRKKILHNLKFALGDELPARQRRAIAKKVLQNFIKNWAELFYAAGPSKKKVYETIRIQDRQYLDQALAQGRGVIALSAHLGNYALIGRKLIDEGYPFSMVVRDLESQVGSEVYRRSREELLGLPSIATTPNKQFYQKALKVLKNNGILCLIADENKRYGGIYVDFFGHPASTAPGPAALSLRTGSPIVPIFIFRDSGNSHTIIIEPEIAWQATGKAAHDIQEITSKFTKVIERYVRKDPCQWIWTNWRWRTQAWGKLDKARRKKKKSLLRRIVKRFKKIAFTLG